MASGQIVALYLPNATLLLVEYILSCSGTSWDPNIEIPDSNYTVIMRVHHGLKWSEDLRLSVRAMMTECRRAGLHFWLLHQVSGMPGIYVAWRTQDLLDAWDFLLIVSGLQDSSSNVPDSNARPTNFILDCPEEVRSIVRTFTAATVHGAYPLLHKFDDPHLRDYLTYLTFLHRYPGYKFAWVLESDVRYTGPDWGSLLNSMLNIAAASLMGTNFQDFDSSLATLPASDVELPDLVLMSHQEIPSESPITSKWAPRDIEHWRFQNLIRVLVNLWGMSRQYIDILHELSVEGNGGYVEDFIATMAVEEKLSIVSMPHAEYGGFSFHCCIPDGTRYYTDWYLTGECRNYALNHPVKNDNESIWGKTQNLYNK